MSKKGGIIIAIIVVVLLIIWAVSRGSSEGTTSSGNAGEASLLKACTLGTFSGTSESLKLDITVNGPQGSGCAITSSVSVASLRGFAEPELFDKNGDGGLAMDCVVPLGLADFNALTKYLQGSDGLAGCSGEYKNYLQNVLDQLNG